MRVPRRVIPPPQKKSRPSLRALFTLAMTTTMVATGGFGAFPENALTQTFQEVISENVSADFLQPFNSYMENISAPTIQPGPASDPKPPLDPIGLLADLPIVINGLIPVELSATSVTQTPTGTLTLTLTTTPTLTLTLTNTPTLTYTPTFTSTATVSPTWTFVPIILSPTKTNQPPPVATSTPSPPCSIISDVFVITTFINNSTTQTVNVYWVDESCALNLYATLGPGQSSVQETYVDHAWRFTDSASGQLIADYVVSGPDQLVDVSTGAVTLPTPTPPTSTATLTLTPTETPATAIPTSGSCVTGSPDTSLHGCLISNVQLDGIQQTTITVSANQTFTFQYTYQVWVAPVCPSCNLGVIAGFESTPASACDYLSNPGVYPGVTFTPAAHTFTAPGTSGSYAIFVRWLQTGACGPGNYQGFGTVIALVTVP